MKKLSYLIVLALILGLVLTGCLLSNVGQVPTSEQSGITYLTKGLPSGLVGWWRFSDNAFDSSGNGNTGTLVNGPQWVAGKFGGNALSFDGVNDYVEVPNSASLNPTSHITVEAWFNAVAGTLTNQKTLVQKPFTSHAVPHYQYTLLLLDTTTKPKAAAFSMTVGGVSHWVIAKDLWYGYGTWHHLAGTYDGSTITLYLDGTDVASKSVSGTISTYDTVLQIGAYPNLSKTSTYCFKGIIDEVRIWDIALTEDQLGSVIVAMDIKPNSCPNPLNTKSKGVTPVAILGTADFDVTEIDPETIKLIGILSDVYPISWNWEDVATPFEPYIGKEDCDLDCNTEGPDGFLDLTFKFDTQELLDAIGTVESFEVNEEELNALESGESDQVTTTNGEILVDGACLVIQLKGELLNCTPIVGEDVVRILKKGNK